MKSFSESKSDQSRIVVRVWIPALRKLTFTRYDEEIEKTFLMGHISFEHESDYRSLWSIEEKAKDARLFFKDQCSMDDYQKIFKDLISHYKYVPEYDPEYKKLSEKAKPQEKLAYENRLENRDPDVVLCIYQRPHGIQLEFLDFEQQIKGFLKSCEEGVPPLDQSKKGWFALERGLLVDRRLGGESCPSVAMRMLSKKPDIVKKGEVENLYPLAPNASFEDFIKMLAKMKRDEFRDRPVTKGYVYPGETPLDRLPKDDRVCVIL